MEYVILACVAFGISLGFTHLVRHYAASYHLIDIPTPQGRKTHAKPTPLGGGIAVFLSFFLVLAGVLFFTHVLGGVSVPFTTLGVVFFASCVLMVGGLLDDTYAIRPWQQMVAPIIAALMVAFSGLHFSELTNPLGGVVPISLSMSRVIIFIWLMVVMYTTKLLDGLDGLATGITGIGAAVIGALALFTKFYQPDVAVLAAILLGSCIGFLVCNFHPAKIFLGEGGSTFVGFMLGVLAVISGGKIATAMLVLGIPVLDVIWVIFQRLRHGKSIFVGDRRHLHFQLLTAGFSHRGAVLFLWTLAALFGFSTLILQSFGKLIALGGVGVVMMVLVFALAFKAKNNDAP